MKKLGKRVARNARAVSVALLFAGGPVAARADYVINSGDVLGLRVIGAPDLDTKSPVDSDGRVILPLIGEMPVAGLSVSEAANRIKSALSSKQLDRHLENGGTMPIVLSPSQISVSIAEYRPIYITGDVAKPGVLSFRPGLTVRQAVALAGGFNLMPFRLGGSIMEFPELKGQFASLSLQGAKDLILIARLKAELNGQQRLDATATPSLPTLRSFTEEITKNEQSQLEARNDDFSKQHDYLVAASQKEAERAQILGEQQENDLKGLSSDTADLQRYEDLFKKGNVTMPSLTEARRAVLASSTRALQDSAALASVEREQGDLGRQLERLSEDRRLQALKDLQDLTADLATTSVRLEAVKAKLVFAGAMKADDMPSFENHQVTIKVTHSENGVSTHPKFLPDMALQPGDVLDIELPPATPLGAPATVSTNGE